MLLLAFAIIAMTFVYTQMRAMAAEGEDAEDIAIEAPEAQPTPTNSLDYVNADQYVTGYYTGVITKDNSNVYQGPGTKAYDKVTTSAGKSVTLAKGTEVTVIGESKDADLDHWYHVKLTFDGEEVSGYVWDGRLERGAQVTFTPTPTPEPTDTPTPTPEEETVEPTPTGAALDNPTKEMVEDSTKGTPWKYIVALCVIVIVVIIVYTILSKREEDRLEEEMKRYTNNNSMERLDGEEDEDWENAVKTHRKRQLVGRGDIPEEDDDFGGNSEDNNEELTIDMSGIFSDDDTTTGTGNDSLDYTDNIDVKTIKETMRQDAEKASRKAADVDITAATDDWNEDDDAYVNSLTRNMSDEDKALFGKIGSSLTAEAGLSQEELIRSRLDQLREQDMVVHKLYGEGEVIDNSDAEVIQIRFGNDLRFLKKDKLAKKDLVVF